MQIQDITRVQEQILDEYSYIAADIQRILKKKGYQLLGHGVDQMAFLAPGGAAVLKIFGAGPARKDTQPGEAIKFSPEQQMFLTWVRYCSRHKDNPFLTRFYGGEGGKPWAPFVFKNRLYIQMWQERLYPGSVLSGELSSLSYMIKRYGVKDVKRSSLGQETVNQAFDLSDTQFLQKMIKELGQKRFDLFLQTIEELVHIGQRHGWSWDLHSNNIMRRENGEPVIVDPWHRSGSD